MYTLVSAMGLSRADNRWKTLDLTTLPMADLYEGYSQSFAVVTNTFTGSQQLCLDLNTIKTQFESFTTPLPTVFTALGSQTLTTSTTIPTITTVYAYYADAIRAGYKIQPVKEGVDITVDIPQEEKTWLQFTKPNIDYNLLYSTCLISINGLYHLTDTDGTKLQVVDGMKSARISGRNQAGVTSFRDVGTLEFLPITTGMVHRRYAGVPLSYHMYINVGTERVGKTAMLVLGGYLHVLDDKTFTQVGPTIYCINFENFPLRDRFMEMRKNIDVSSLNLDIDAQNPDKVSDGQLHSDAVLTAIATLSQSFLVFVNNPTLFVERDPIQTSRIRTKYISYTEPMYPMVAGLGRLCDYWRVKEHGYWAITVADGIRNNYVFNSAPEDLLAAVSSARLPYHPTMAAEAVWLKVGSDIKS